MVIGSLSKLETVDLSGNKNLTGHIPSSMANINVSVKGSGISTVTIKQREVSGFVVIMLIIVHIFLGRFDYGSDLLSLWQMVEEKNLDIFFLNLCFIVLSIIIGLMPFPQWLNKPAYELVLNLLNLGSVLEGCRTILEKKQTEGFVLGKKMDAVCRSMPSLILQLFLVLKSLDTMSALSYRVFLASIALAFLGTSVALAQLAPKAGEHLISFNFVLHFAYFLAEILFRVAILDVMFLSIRYIGLIVAFVDWLFRFFLINTFASSSLSDAFQSAVIWWGSDMTSQNTDLFHGFLIGSVLNFLMVIIFIPILFTGSSLNEETSADLRTIRSNGVARDISIVIGASFLMKTFIGVYIVYYLKEDVPDKVIPLSTKDEDDHIEGSSNEKSADAGIAIFAHAIDALV